MKRIPFSVQIKIVLSIVLLIALFLAVGRQLAHAQANQFLTISGNTDQVVFNTNWDPSGPLQLYWGVSNQPMHPQTFTIVNRTAVLVPPLGTVSLFFNTAGITVVTEFTPLTSDGWYEVPQALHAVTVTGNTALVQFTANYTPTTTLNVTWGVSGLPAVTQSLVFTNRVATIVPPTNTVSMLFAPPGVVVNTEFPNLGSGWYAVPTFTPPPPVFDKFVYIPLALR